MKEERPISSNADHSTSSGFVGRWFIEIILCALCFFTGFWQVQSGWGNPGPVGWVPSGAVYMVGALFCGWLAWRRRNTDRHVTLFFLLVPQLALMTRACCMGWANDLEARWLMGSSILALLSVAVGIWAIDYDRKAKARAATKATFGQVKHFERGEQS